MINIRHLRDEVIIPTLDHIGLNYDDNVINLIMGTAAQESGFYHLKQLNDGPARGVYQIEPDTHDDIYKNFLLARPELHHRVRELCMPNDIMNRFEQIAGNLYYATALCRIHYWRIPEPVPDTLEKQADYYKQHYNTPAGKATPAEYIANYDALVAPSL